LARLKEQRLVGHVAVTHGGVIGQVWRGGAGRRALWARALEAVDVVAIDEDLGRRVGTLLATSGTTDVIDAAVVLLARAGDEIHTSDPSDIEHLARAAGADVEIVPI
jgi:hypothetical protein